MTDSSRVSRFSGTVVSGRLNWEELETERFFAVKY